MEAFNAYCVSEGGPLGNAIRFDESRISEAQEGWIPVVLNGKWPYHNVTFENDRGFLHNWNCD
jgi:hypothetical protein